MKTKNLLIFGICIIVIGCANKTKQDSTTEVALVTSQDDSIESKEIARFDSLFNAWEKEILTNPKTKYSSNTQTYTTLPQFTELVTMGKKIIPYIVERFEKDSNSFFALPLYNELQEIEELKSHSKISQQEKVKEVIRKFREQKTQKDSDI